MAKSVAVIDGTETGLQKAESQPARLLNFLHSVRAEMRKVIAPTRAEVQSTTLVVVGTVFVFATYFWVVDSVIGRIIERAINGLAVHP